MYRYSRVSRSLSDNPRRINRLHTDGYWLGLAKK